MIRPFGLFIVLGLLGLASVLVAQFLGECRDPRVVIQKAVVVEKTTVIVPAKQKDCPVCPFAAGQAEEPVEQRTTYYVTVETNMGGQPTQLRLEVSPELFSKLRQGDVVEVQLSLSQGTGRNCQPPKISSAP